MKLTLDTATFSAAIDRAAKVAPTKGPHKDLAAGILLQPAGAYLLVKATDTEVTIIEKVHMPRTPELEEDEELHSWRLPAGLLAPFVASLDPQGKIEIADVENNRVQIAHESTKITLSKLDPDTFPEIPTYPPDDMQVIPDLARKIRSVVWARHRDVAPFSGVHFNGNRVTACDKESLGEIEADVDFGDGMTVPMSAVASALGDGDIKLKTEGDRLVLMPYEDVQITTTIFAAAYPPLDHLRTQTFSGITKIEIDPQALSERLQRMMVLTNDREFPLARLVVEQKQIIITMSVPETGDMEDVCPHYSDYDAEPFECHVNPLTLSQALRGCRGTIEFGFKEVLKPLTLEDKNGYSAFIMPRRAA